MYLFPLNQILRKVQQQINRHLRGDANYTGLVSIFATLSAHHQLKLIKVLRQKKLIEKQINFNRGCEDIWEYGDDIWQVLYE